MLCLYLLATHFSYLTHHLLIFKSITVQTSTLASHHQPNPSHLLPRNSSTSSLWSGHLVQTSQPTLSLRGSLITSANVAIFTSSTPLLMPASSICCQLPPQQPLPVPIPCCPSSTAGPPTIPLQSFLWLQPCNPLGDPHLL